MKTIDINVSGPVGCGKSAILAMIERELRRQGFAFRYANPAEDVPEKNLADVVGELAGLDRGAVAFVLRSDGGAAVDGSTAPLGVGYTPGKGWRRLGLGDGRDIGANRLFSGIEPRTVDGQEVVAIPAFHYRVESDDAGFRLWLSAQPRDGYTRHPAFMLDGAPMDEILVGAYEASGGDVAASQRGEKPMVNVSLPEMRNACAARGEGWGLWSIYELAAIQMLALVEVGHPDLQDAIGRGNVSGSGAVPGGSTSAAWRGLHELWGNVFHWVDGLRVSAAGDIEAWDLAGRREWVNTEIRSQLVEEGGWPTAFHAEPEIDALLLPCAVTGDRDQAMVRDYHFGAWEDVESYPIHGGSWGSGSYAGLFSLTLNNAPANSCTNIGGRLAKRVRSSAN
ncbi:hypothetical protein [Rhodospirillum centenum]|uniref:Uncharacterized protein n=1 Tax=Rhodospirillum centenum (strain ATCC 51521 / SW) TaxID=414684 RepID=B6IMD9_RHOCS|nr:hypothetical protein [Rhodospirillum centenum]ACI98518.1 phage-related hypothetical protein [Rhodospirillum centenum SW]